METDCNPAQLIAKSAGLLLDFDGPICDLYAGSDPARIARDVAAAFKLDINTDDPLKLITHAMTTNGPVDEIHQALTDTEIEAARTATETPGVRTLIERYEGSIAIVSNNARDAIAAWLAAADLMDRFDAVIGRAPRHMKPDPKSLRTAADSIGCPIDRCIFVGDSLTDATAARRAGVPLIALANRPDKWQLFSHEVHLAIVESIHELTSSACDEETGWTRPHQRP